MSFVDWSCRKEERDQKVTIEVLHSINNNAYFELKLGGIIRLI